jgi:NAD(P)-dependent dehydrogenase (short-subunit alcohol dehydrogenase family)
VANLAVARNWRDTDIPDQTGRTAFVTGSTGGLGLRIALVLAEHGARVLLGARNADKGARAVQQVAAGAAGEPPELIHLDLSGLASVRSAATSVRTATGDRLDLLINNGGVMAPPLTFSPDGFELQWATNVIGPAALTWLLLPALEATPDSRIVWVSSDQHRRARLDEATLKADLHGERYRGFDTYGRTKLADLQLSHELQRHFARTDSSALSVAAHPGFTATGIVGAGFAALPRWMHRIATAATGILGQSVEAGALPILYAATAPGVTGDQFFGPTRLGELRGPPGIARRSAASEDDAQSALLSRFISEQTGIPRPA